jgi:hypothetical protein
MFICYKLYGYQIQCRKWASERNLLTQNSFHCNSRQSAINSFLERQLILVVFLTGCFGCYPLCSSVSWLHSYMIKFVFILLVILLGFMFKGMSFSGVSHLIVYFSTQRSSPSCLLYFKRILILFSVSSHPSSLDGLPSFYRNWSNSVVPPASTFSNSAFAFGLQLWVSYDCHKNSRVFCK